MLRSEGQGIREEQMVLEDLECEFNGMGGCITTQSGWSKDFIAQDDGAECERLVNVAARISAKIVAACGTEIRGLREEGRGIARNAGQRSSSRAESVNVAMGRAAQVSDESTAQRVALKSLAGAPYLRQDPEPILILTGDRLEPVLWSKRRSEVCCADFPAGGHELQTLNHGRVRVLGVHEFIEGLSRAGDIHPLTFPSRSYEGISCRGKAVKEIHANSTEFCGLQPLESSAARTRRWEETRGGRFRPPPRAPPRERAQSSLKTPTPTQPSSFTTLHTGGSIDDSGKGMSPSIIFRFPTARDTPGAEGVELCASLYTLRCARVGEVSCRRWDPRIERGVLRRGRAATRGVRDAPGLRLPIEALAALLDPMLLSAHLGALRIKAFFDKKYVQYKVNIEPPNLKLLCKLCNELAKCVNHECGNAHDIPSWVVSEPNLIPSIPTDRPTVPTILTKSQPKPQPPSQRNRELAQKPHEPHAAFVHCAKPHGKKKKSEVSQGTFNEKLPELRERPWEVNELHRHFICRVQAAKSVRKASGARVVQASCVGKTASHASASNPYDFRITSTGRLAVLTLNSRLGKGTPTLMADVPVIGALRRLK
ncbi:hypothetical protein FB451DRAFT_1180538 [Mycena latifolia]|nr:hypothetical protein FB451DRAFT_1180538 [Mycena latifolia]